MRKGDSWLKPALVEAARAAARTKTCRGAKYHRLARRTGANRAAMAVAHSMLVILHHLIRTGQDYTGLGYDYLEQRDRESIVKRSLKRLQRLGFQVTLQAA